MVLAVQCKLKIKLQCLIFRACLSNYRNCPPRKLHEGTTVFMLIKWKPKKNYKSHLRIIRVTIIMGSEFPSVIWMLRSNRNIHGTLFSSQRPRTLLNMLVYVHKVGTLATAKLSLLSQTTASTQQQY